MTSLTNRALSVYREDGALVLGKKTLQKLYIKSYCQVVSLCGSYSVRLDDQTGEFFAPMSTMAKRIGTRFQSEREELRGFLNTIELEDTVYDAGENTGLYSLFAATKCRCITFAAFEPYPPNLESLKRNFDQNGLHNIEVVEAALSNSVGEIEFSQPGEDSVRCGSPSLDAEKNNNTFTDPTTTGNTLVADKELLPPDIVKVDVGRRNYRWSRP